MSETIEQPEKLRDDPINFLAQQAERIDLLERQVAALMRMAEARLPPGVAIAWPVDRPAPHKPGVEP